MMEELQQIQANLYNFFWFRLSRYLQVHINNYNVNQTVFDLYTAQSEWSKELREEMKNLSRDMCSCNGFEQLCEVAKDLQDPSVSRQRLLVILYIAVYIAKIYINSGEQYAVKYIIIKLQEYLAKAIQKQDAGNL